MKDTRYTYGANCNWHGPIQEVKTRGGLPCCPHCSGMLFEYDSKEEWDSQVDRFSKEHNLPRYRDFVDSWRKGPCKNLHKFHWREEYDRFLAATN